MATIAILGIVVPLAVALVLLLVIAVGAGALGSLLGLGGGLVLVPAIVVLFGIDIHFAIAASLVSVIATSSGAATSRAEPGYVNLRLAMFLETATAAGGLAGALVAVTVLAARSDVLELAFVAVVGVAAVYMFVGRERDIRRGVPAHPLAVRLGLVGEIPRPFAGGNERYGVIHPWSGLGVSGLAGVASGLFGIGGGLIKVPAMNALMNVPMRVATATSTLMIGVTAAAGALVYLIVGDVGLLVAAPTALGTLAGSRWGARARDRIPVRQLKPLFAAVIVAAAVSLLAQALGVLP